MTVWLISAGGSDDAFLPKFHEYKAAVFSFKEGGDISGLTKAQIIARFEGQPYLDKPGKIIERSTAIRYASQLIHIRDHVKKGDYLFTRIEGGAKFLIGRVKKNPYEYHPEHDVDHRHILRTKWATPVLAETLADLVSDLGTHRWTIRTPKNTQQELTKFADACLS